MNKILFLIDSLQAGGAEQSILEIAGRLKEFKPIVAVLFSDKDDLRKSFQTRGIELYDLEIQRNAWNWFLKARTKFQTLCEQIRPTIVHAHLFKSEMIARTCTLPKGTILVGAFVNDSYSSERYRVQSALRNMKLDAIKFLDRITIQRNFRVTSISSAIAKSNTSALKYPMGRVKLIYRGREIDSPAAEPVKRSSPFTFLIVSRLLVRKGYLELIEAVNLLKKAGKFDFRILAAGEGADRGLIVETARKRGVDADISFLGYRDDVRQLLEKADCFVFPSHYEGQGGALVEAMLAGKPIVVSDIDVFREQLDHGRSARFFTLRDVNALAESMAWVMQNYREAVQMGLRAREIAERRFDINLIVGQHEDFYKQVITDFRNKSAE